MHISIDGMGIVLFSQEVMKSVVPGSGFLKKELYWLTEEELGTVRLKRSAVNVYGIRVAE